MSALDAFLDHAKKQGMKENAAPIAIEMFKMLNDVRTATVDECLDLVGKWAEITQMSDRPDVKMLLQTMAALKEDLK